MKVATVEWQQADIGSVYREEAGRLWRALLLSTGRPEVASDAVSEAFAQAIRRWSDIRDHRAWIWRAAHRIASGELAAAATTASLQDAPDIEIPEPTLDALDVLEPLTYHQRSALVLHIYAGYSYREIAQILGSTVAAVGVHIHRAKRKVRERMEGSDA